MDEIEGSHLYYGYYRDEVKREDGITQSRTMTSMTLHGFLFASATFLLSNPWWETEPGSIQLRIAMILGVGVAGLLVSLATYVGVIASTISLAHIQADFDHLTRSTVPILKLDSRAPQITGRPGVSKLGTFYAEALQVVLAFLWAGYIGICLSAFFYAPLLVVGSVPLLSISLMVSTRWVTRKANRHGLPVVVGEKVNDIGSKKLGV